MSPAALLQPGTPDEMGRVRVQFSTPEVTIGCDRFDGEDQLPLAGFANQLSDHGLSGQDAVMEAWGVRLCPVFTTSFAIVLGAVPLTMATGADAESRMALGVLTVGGITVSAVVMLFAIPALYMMLAPFPKPTGAMERLLPIVRPGLS